MNIEIAEIQVFVTDLKRSREFYENVLGLRLKEHRDNWLIFDLSPLELVVMENAKKPFQGGDYGATASVVPCFSTPDIDKTFQKLKEKGAQFFSDIKIVPQGKFVALQDPDGNQIELIQRNQAWSEHLSQK